MWTWLRRMFWLSLMFGAGYAAYAGWQRRTEPEPGAPPEWPPLSESNRSTGDGDRSGDDDGSGDAQPISADASTDAPAWVPPVDGACPDGYPIKANDNSGIYHVPGGRFYERTVPERCYADETAAQSDGYRRAKA